jgi:hypothetical protein
VLLLAAQRSAANLVVNGEFDTDGSGWAQIDWVDSNWFGDRFGVKGWDGNPGWFFVNGFGAGAETSQLVSGLSPGQTYVVSGYYHRDTANWPGDPLRVLMDDTEYFTPPPSRDEDVWRPFAFNYVAVDSDVLLRFQTEFTGDDAYGIDHIELNLIPEPAAAITLAAAGMLVAARPRRLTARPRL